MTATEKRYLVGTRAGERGDVRRTARSIARATRLPLHVSNNTTRHAHIRTYQSAVITTTQHTERERVRKYAGMEQARGRPATAPIACSSAAMRPAAPSLLSLIYRSFNKNTLRTVVVVDILLKQIMIVLTEMTVDRHAAWQYCHSDSTRSPASAQR
jgi:hypothetical protein